jgi:hypothetical protein
MSSTTRPQRGDTRRGLPSNFSPNFSPSPDVVHPLGRGWPFSISVLGCPPTGSNRQPSDQKADRHRTKEHARFGQVSWSGTAYPRRAVLWFESVSRESRVTRYIDVAVKPLRERRRLRHRRSAWHSTLG